MQIDLDSSAIEDSTLQLSVRQRRRSRMHRWTGKVAVVTGASSGIGEAVSIALVERGLKVVGVARRLERMQRTADKLKNAKGVFYPVQGDLSKEEDILKTFVFVETLGGVDILINNAGVLFGESVIDGATTKFETTLDINVLAPAICCREATRSMRKRGTEGHIINISSIVGHYVSEGNTPLGLYQVSKHALNAISDVVRNEITIMKAPIRVTNVSPGLVKTDMPANVAGTRKIFDMLPYIEANDIVDSILHVLAAPPHVQITELSIRPLHERLNTTGQEMQ